MCVAKKIFLLLALIILSATNVEAADDDLPFDTLAIAYPVDESSILALIRMKSDGSLGLMVAEKSLEPIGLVGYSRAVYDFYLTEKTSAGYPPLIFNLVIPQQQRGQVDDDLGDWSDNVHIVPVYALFDVKDGQVICQKPFYSASGLNPSHYQGRIQNPNHERLVELFMTYMPHLHESVAAQNISLP